MDFSGNIVSSSLKKDVLEIVIDEAQAEETFRFNIEDAVILNSSSNIMGSKEAAGCAQFAAGNWKSEDNYAVALYLAKPQPPAHQISLSRKWPRKNQIYGFGSATRLVNYQPQDYSRIFLAGKGEIGTAESKRK